MTFDTNTWTNVLIATGVVGSIIAYYKRAVSANWREVADQRLAAITDRDRQLVDQQRENEDVRKELALMKQTVSKLEGEIAELKRHDLSSVIHMIERLATATEQVKMTSVQRERENEALFSDLRTHVFPMIEEIYKKVGG